MTRPEPGLCIILDGRAYELLWWDRGNQDAEIWKARTIYTRPEIVELTITPRTEFTVLHGNNKGSLSGWHQAIHEH